MSRVEYGTPSVTRYVRPEAAELRAARRSALTTSLTDARLRRLPAWGGGGKEPRAMASSIARRLPFRPGPYTRGRRRTHTCMPLRQARLEDEALGLELREPVRAARRGGIFLVEALVAALVHRLPAA